MLSSNGQSFIMHDVMYMSIKPKENIETFKEQEIMKVLKSFEQHNLGDSWIFLTLNLSLSISYNFLFNFGLSKHVCLIIVS
jgi:hypothetical protein